MEKVFIPRGVCSRKYVVTLNDGVIENIVIEGGCDGNLKGIAALLRGRRAEEVIPLIRGVKCGMKRTSCPDQISYALEEALKEEQEA